MIVQGCLAWEDIEEREVVPENDSIIPMVLSTTPPFDKSVIPIYRRCISYNFSIVAMIDARTNEILTSQNVFINWFLDYQSTIRVPVRGTKYSINIYDKFSSEPDGSLHTVDLFISDKSILQEGDDPNNINWDVADGAYVEHIDWVIQIVDDERTADNSYCSGYANE